MNARTFFAASLAGLLTVNSAFALEVVEELRVDAPPEAVWTAIGDFCGIALWHPGFASCELSLANGFATRKLTTRAGAVFTERQKSRDDAELNYTYMIVDGTLPVSNYTATMRVVARGRDSTVRWSATFDANGVPDARAREVISGIFRAGLDGLSRRF